MMLSLSSVSPNLSFSPAPPVHSQQQRSVPIQLLLWLCDPIFTTTQTAHVVKPYTNASGIYFAVVQHTRSILRAQRRAIILKDARDRCIRQKDGRSSVGRALDHPPSGGRRRVCEVSKLVLVVWAQLDGSRCEQGGLKPHRMLGHGVFYCRQTGRFVVVYSSDGTWGANGREPRCGCAMEEMGPGSGGRANLSLKSAKLQVQVH